MTTHFPRLSTKNDRVLPPCVIDPRRPSTAPTTSPTMLVTLLRVLMSRGFRSSDWKTRPTISTRWPSTVSTHDHLRLLPPLTQSHNQLKLCVHVCDRNVDFLDPNLYAGVDLDELCDVGVQVNVCGQVLRISSQSPGRPNGIRSVAYLHIQLNLLDGELGYIQIHVRRRCIASRSSRASRRCARCRCGVRDGGCRDGCARFSPRSDLNATSQRGQKGRDRCRPHRCSCRLCLVCQGSIQARSAVALQRNPQSSTTHGTSSPADHSPITASNIAPFQSRQPKSQNLVQKRERAVLRGASNLACGR